MAAAWICTLYFPNPFIVAFPLKFIVDCYMVMAYTGNKYYFCVTAANACIFPLDAFVAITGDEDNAFIVMAEG
jgi:phospholipase/lecithinase/hemolysin